MIGLNPGYLLNIFYFTQVPTLSLNVNLEISKDIKISGEGARSDRSSFDGIVFNFLICQHMGVQFPTSSVFEKTCFKGGNLKFVNLNCSMVKNVKYDALVAYLDINVFSSNQRFTRKG